MSEIEENIFTTKLLDVILPEGVIVSKVNNNFHISEESNIDMHIDSNKDGQKTVPAVNIE